MLKNVKIVIYSFVIYKCAFHLIVNKACLFGLKLKGNWLTLTSCWQSIPNGSVIQGEVSGKQSGIFLQYRSHYCHSILGAVSLITLQCWHVFEALFGREMYIPLCGHKVTKRRYRTVLKIGKDLPNSDETCEPRPRPFWIMDDVMCGGKEKVKPKQTPHGLRQNRIE